MLRITFVSAGNAFFSVSSRTYIDYKVLPIAKDKSSLMCVCVCFSHILLADTQTRTMMIRGKWSPAHSFLLVRAGREEEEEKEEEEECEDDRTARKKKED